MKTKIIPFDLETAKKIQAGKIEGCVKDTNGIVGTIVTFNGSNTPLPIVVKFSFPDGDNIFFVGNDGVSTRIELVLEVYDTELEMVEETQRYNFKPFDKVLVRDKDNQCWTCGLFSHKNISGYYACGLTWNQCIPYEGNERLVGTDDKPNV